MARDGIQEARYLADLPDSGVVIILSSLPPAELLGEIEQYPPSIGLVTNLREVTREEIEEGFEQSGWNSQPWGLIARVSRR